MCGCGVVDDFDLVACGVLIYCVACHRFWVIDRSTTKDSDAAKDDKLVGSSSFGIEPLEVGSRIHFDHSD